MTDFDVVLAAVVAGGVPRAYKTNEVPDRPQLPYTVVHVTRDLPGNRDMTGTAGTWDRRATFQSFDLDPDGALDFDRMAVNALDGQILAGIDGMWTVQIAAALVRDPDRPNVVGVTSTLTCTAAP